MRELLRAVAKTVGGSLAALLMGMAVVKIIAHFIGPEGVGFFSLLRQTQQVAIALAMVNGHTALVQGIASQEGEARARYISVVFWVVVVLSAAVLLVFTIAPGEISHWLFGRAVSGTPAAFRLVGVSVMCGVAFTFASGVLIGHGLVGRASLVQFVNYAVVAILAYPLLMIGHGVTPADYGWLLVSGTAAAALFSTVMVWRARIVRIRRAEWNPQSAAAARHFFTFSSGMMVAGVVGTAVPLAVRALVVRGFGLGGAGVFDAAWTLSMSYVLIVLTSFSSFYLPSLSAVRDPVVRVEIIERVFRLAIILMVPLVTGVIVFKPLVVSLLYSSAFTPSLVIMRWMLIGDYFKVMSWVFSYTMLAYADIKMFMVTETIWGLLTLAGAFVSVRFLHSLEMLGVIFVLLYVAYFVVMLQYVMGRHGIRFGKHAILQPLAGFVVIVASSALTWNDTVVRWPAAVLCVGAAALVSWLLLSRDERASVRAWIALRRTAQL